LLLWRYSDGFLDFCNIIHWLILLGVFIIFELEKFYDIWIKQN
jgi:hypothetical protein